MATAGCGARRYCSKSRACREEDERQRSPYLSDESVAIIFPSEAFIKWVWSGG